jgi:mannose-6-phosphate isomerase-like protein (cupin superfamily)
MDKMAIQNSLTQSSAMNPDNSDAWSEVTPGERFIIRMSSDQTNGGYMVLEVEADYLNGTPMHVHENAAEHFIIIEGEARIACGDKIVDAPAGTTLTVPRNDPHAWCNLSKIQLRMVVVFTPGGIDDLFRIIDRGGDIDFPALLARFGCLIVGPALTEAIKSTSLLDQLEGS